LRFITSAALAVLVGACAPTAELNARSQQTVIELPASSLFLDEAVVPPPLALQVSAMQPGGVVIAAVAGVPPGIPAHFALGLAPATSGSQTCLPANPNACWDIASPFYLGSATPDGDGVARLQIQVPGFVPAGTRVIVQAMATAGPVVAKSGPSIVMVEPDQCEYPDWELGEQGPTGAAIAPSYWSMGFIGAMDGVHVRDFDGLSGPNSAQLSFVLYDDNFNSICSVLFDASDAQQVNPASWGPADSGVSPVVGYELTTGLPRWTDCGPVDPNQFGTADISEWFFETWGIGFGPLGTIGADLEAAVDGSGLDWAADWDPYVFSTWLWVPGWAPVEFGYSFAFEETCGVMTAGSTGTGVYIPAPNGPLAGVVEAYNWYVFAF
jgi:hypothetical protein